MDHFPPNWRIEVVGFSLRGIGAIFRDQVTIPRNISEHHTQIMRSISVMIELTLPLLSLANRIGPSLRLSGG